MTFSIDKKDISIIDSWIHVRNIGRIGLYSPSRKEILLDYSMKWIIGTNKSISCKYSEIENKIIELFQNKFVTL